MKISRREILHSAALSGAALSLAGCNSIYSTAAKRLGQDIPEHVTLAGATSDSIDRTFHLLSRAGYGPWPGDLKRVLGIGHDAWVEEQLNPEKLDDRLCELRARRYETIHLDPGTCYEFKRESLRKDLTRYSLLRSVYSKRQLFEVMVGFWTDHLNIYIEKGDCMNLKATDDRTVVRPHALGKFKDLIRASALSPAMLVYLDGKENKKDGPYGIPNENYARELLELHTLGVDGGYTQKDVFEVARCFTGWRLKDKWQRGKVYFDANLHDDGEKVVLGTRIAPGGGEKDVERVIEIVCSHPSTARHIATKLVKRFVCDEPPGPLVDSAARDFSSSGGDIKTLVRTILKDDDFKNASDTKLKRPFHFIVSALRSLGADTHASDELIEYLTRMGHGPFQYPTPDGYPDEAAPWIGTLLWRWNFAFALASNTVKGVNVSVDRLMQAIGTSEKDNEFHAQLFTHFIGRQQSADEKEALNAYSAKRTFVNATHRAELVGLILSSPAFQRY